MSMGEYEGVVVFNPPESRSFQGQPTPGTPQWFELTRGEWAHLSGGCVGSPVRTEHGGETVGQVTHAFFTPEGHAAIQFAFADSDVGRQARVLVESGLMRGLSLCHDATNMRVMEVSICMQGARPNTGITRKLAGAETNQQNYKAQQPVSFSNATVVKANLVSRLEAQRMSAQPGFGLPQTQQPNTVYQAPPGAPLGAPPYTGAPGQMNTLNNFTTQQQQQQQPTPGASVHFMNTQQAAQLNQQVGMQTQNTPMQYQQAERTPNMGPLGTAETDLTTNDMNKKRKMDETGQQQQPDAEMDDGKLLEQLIQSRGALSDAMKARVVDAFIKQRKEAEDYKKQVDTAQAQVSTFKQSADSLRNHFFDTLIPFMQAQLGKDSFTDNDAQAMRHEAAQNEGASAFLSKFGPVMVKASQAATLRLQSSDPAQHMDPELRRRLEMVRSMNQRGQESHIVSTGQTVRASAYAMEPLPATSRDFVPQQNHYGWKPVEPAAAPVVDVFGGQVSLADFGMSKMMRA